MTRSFRRTGLRRIGVLGACTVAAAAFAAAAPAQAVDGFEFTLYAKEVPGEGVTETGQTPKVGDVFTVADDLYRTKGGDTVGRDGVTCAVVRVSGDQADANCVGTFVLNGGPGGQTPPRPSSPSTSRTRRPRPTTSPSPAAPATSRRRADTSVRPPTGTTSRWSSTSPRADPGSATTACRRSPGAEGALGVAADEIGRVVADVRAEMIV
ncbi:hypothetical protein STANM309S_01638 [Streptomyces tanashiensis]